MNELNELEIEQIENVETEQEEERLTVDFPTEIHAAYGCVIPS